MYEYSLYILTTMNKAILILILSNLNQVYA